MALVFQYGSNTSTARLNGKERLVVMQSRSELFGRKTTLISTSRSGVRPTSVLLPTLLLVREEISGVFCTKFQIG